MTIIWIDAHLSPTIATWITNTFLDVTAIALRDFAAEHRQTSLIIGDSLRSPEFPDYGSLLFHHYSSL